MILVRMTSEPFGNDDFEYHDMDSALAGIRRLVESAEGDGVERLIGIVVNADDDQE